MGATGGRVAAVTIRADFLRQYDALAEAGALSGGIAMADAAAGSGQGEIQAEKPLKPRYWRERELRRAIRAAEKAGLSSYRIEIAPDGTIAIDVTPARRAKARKPRFLSHEG